MALTLKLEKMTLKEKLQTMEKLWDSISQHKGNLTSPAWHEAYLKDTEARYVAGDDSAIDWDVAKRELRKQFE